MSTRSRISVVMFSLALFMGTSALAQAPFETSNGILVDESGMAVYTFDKDTPNSGTSSCYENCAKNWPPVQAEAEAKAEGDYTIIEREDGLRQWAYQGQPLYTYAKDNKAGDMNGDEVGGVWRVVKQ